MNARTLTGWAAAVVSLFAVFAAGCSPKAAETAAAPAASAAPAGKPATSFAEESRRIQEDPNLPDAVKQARLQAARERYGPTAAQNGPR